MNEFGREKKRQSLRQKVVVFLGIVIGIILILFFMEASFVSKTKITHGRTDGHGHVIERTDSVLEK